MEMGAGGGSWKNLVRVCNGLAFANLGIGGRGGNGGGGEMNVFIEIALALVILRGRPSLSSFSLMIISIITF